MAVAPSFKDFERLTEPFAENGKWYIVVKHPNTGNSRKVRWYSELEYAKNYANKLTEEEKTGIPNLKTIRGFAKGPIVVIRNIKNSADEAWCEHSVARFAVGIGWHFVSTDTLPDEIPSHLKFTLLNWDEFRDNDETHMKTPDALAAIIDKKIKNKEFFAFNQEM